MARVAVISDIHGNLHALQAVLDAIRAMRIRDVVCLGDVVGYGPKPRECLDLIMQHCRHTVQGNHDEAAYNRAAAANFNGYARFAIEWTRDQLATRHLELLQLLPQVAYIEDDCMCIHDCPVPATPDYVHDAQMASIAFRGVDTRVCLLGHTHVPIVFEAPTPNVEDDLGPHDISAYGLQDGQSIRLQDRRRYICNPGAVGQPRDSDPRASFGILDIGKWTWSLHRVEYDINAAQLATQQAGLPPILAERLALGA